MGNVASSIGEDQADAARPMPHTTYCLLQKPEVLR